MNPARRRSCPQRRGAERLSGCLFASAVQILWLTAAVAPATEILHPGGYQVQSTYEIGLTTLRAWDTLIIRRSVTNRENTALYGLYLAENLPPRFSPVRYELTLNGDTVTHEFTPAQSDWVVDGYGRCEWIVDDPNPGSAIRNPLYPGDSVALELHIVPDSVGLYVLPLHTAGFSLGGTTAFFSTGDSVAIEVLPALSGSCGNVNGDSIINASDLIYLVNYIFKGGPEPVSGWHAADANGDGRVTAADLIALVNYVFRGGVPPSCS